MANTRMRSELPLILASLFIAAVIWLIAKQADYEPDRLQAAVVLEGKPDYMEVEAPGKINILVQYPKSMSNLIVEKNFSVPINIEQVFNIKPGEWDPPTSVKEVDYTLRPGSIKTGLEGVQVVSVDPEVIELKARLRTQLADITVPTTGTLPANLMLVDQPQTDPAQLLLTGPPEALTKLAEAKNVVRTEPLNLSALSGSGQFALPVVLPDPELQVLGLRSDKVTVNVAVAERPVRQTIAGVPVSLVTFAPDLRARIEPAQAEVTVEGPASALKAITANDIEFSPIRPLTERPGRVYDIGIEARLKSTVAPEAAKQIRIVEIKPSRISVEFVPVDTQDK